MEIYLDHAATTWVYPEAAQAALDAMRTDFGNPSSMHKKGVEAEHIIRDGAKKIAALLKAKEKEIFFTSGGTESNNWALMGAAAAHARRGRRIVTSAAEHASVLEPLKRLEELGFEIVRIGVDKDGIVNADKLREAVNEETILVSIMTVNNETGSLQPIRELSRAAKEKNASLLFHTDAIQAYGKYEISPTAFGVDMMSISGHKIHAPKGVGVLYVREKARILPLIYGGGQQRSMRSGTDNVPGVAAFAAASQKIYSTRKENEAKMRALKKRLEDGLLSIEGTASNTPKGELSAPHILNVSFEGIKSEVLLHSLEEKGVYISSGSACSSHKNTPSPALKAMGLDNARVESSVRFSLCETTSEEEIDAAVRAVQESVPILRRYTRR